MVDIHDDDAGVGVCVLARAIAEARVERVQLEALEELEDRRGPLAEKRQNVYQQRGGGEALADPERDLVLPPGAPDGPEAAWALAIRLPGIVLDVASLRRASYHGTQVAASRGTGS